ncbi:DMT family transporter [Microcoleus sp. FACHB-68]|uniref:DMT family transporter n=1 Tax=Microcoleus sp. FACHB-68 TaxID=2692826 RepID=UPI00168508A2|nr:DMT family transporter [Microcoleus sp. FACHB-68]MBD1938383.1 DMT family transporter [Microcoleus sp. FACHB-68]
MSLAERPARWQVGLVLIAGILAISTAAIFIRLAIAAAGAGGVGFSLVLAASRLALAGLILLPTWRRIQFNRLDRGALRFAGMAGFFLALHFATWITSLSYTSIAASTALVTTNPVWVAILSWLWFKEKPTAQQAAGIAIAFAGGLCIGFADAGSADAGSNPLWGDFLALLGSVAISLYLLLGREAQRRGLGIGGYVAVAYTVAALVLLPLPPMFGAGYIGYPREVYLYLLLMAIFPQLIGHTSFNWAVVWISPTLVTLAILFEPVGSSLLGYLLFREVPPVPVLGGAAVLLAGVAIAALGARKEC